MENVIDIAAPDDLTRRPDTRPRTPCPRPTPLASHSGWCLALDNSLSRLPPSSGVGVGVFLTSCPDQHKTYNQSTGFWSLLDTTHAASGSGAGAITGRLASLYGGQTGGASPTPSTAACVWRRCG